MKAKTETERQEAEKAEKEALKQRAQSRSPTRQSPTSTSGLGSGGGNTPPPPAQETLSRNARSLDFIHFKAELLQLNRTQFSSLGIFVSKKVGNRKN